MNRQQTVLGLIGYFFIGTATVLLPSIMPFIDAEYGAAGFSLTAIALIFPASAIGGILGSLISGIGSDLMGRQQLVWIAALLLAISLAIAGVAQSWLLFLLGFALISATRSALSTGINAMIADANRGTQARALNVLHGVYSIGAAISPLLFGYLIGLGLPWRWVLGGIGLIWLGYAALLYLLHADQPLPSPKQATTKLDLSMLRHGPFLALFAISFIYNGVAWSLLGWVAIFMQESAGLSTSLSLSVIAIFYGALTLGRFICAAITESLGYTKVLILLTIGIALTYPLVVFGKSAETLVLGIFLTGLSLSGLSPIALAYGARLYPQQTGTLTGTLSIAITLGSMLPPFWTGLVADAWSFQIALGLNYSMVVILIGVVVYLSRVDLLGESGEAN